MLDSHSISSINGQLISAQYLISDHLWQPGIVKNLITTDAGRVEIADIILHIDAGCLAKDTEITLRINDRHVDLKTLLDLGLIQRASNVVEFFPNSLKFLKPADLKFQYGKIHSDNELFVLRGSYSDNQKTVWELVHSDMIHECTEKGVVMVKIEDFSLYCYIVAMRGRLSRIFSHLHKSFTCFAYALYRRVSISEIDISIVLVSEFVREDEKKAIKQLNDLYKEGYVKSDKRTAKRLQIDSYLQLCLGFPEYKGGPFSFLVDELQLDSIGYVIDHFKRIPIKYPAKGTVTISDVYSVENSTNKSGLPWVLNIVEEEQKAVQDKVPGNL